MGKFVAVQKPFDTHPWRVVYRTNLDDGYASQAVCQKILELRGDYASREEAEAVATKVNAELFPVYRVVPFAELDTKAVVYRVAKVKRMSCGLPLGRLLSVEHWPSGEAAEAAVIHNLRWQKDCLANQRPLAVMNGVRISQGTKQGKPLFSWFRGLLPNGRLLDFDVRELREFDPLAFGKTQRVKLSFDLAGWIEEHGLESYLNLDR